MDRSLYRRQGRRRPRLLRQRPGGRGPALKDVQCAVDGTPHKADAQGRIDLGAWAFPRKASFECQGPTPKGARPRRPAREATGQRIHRPREPQKKSLAFTGLDSAAMGLGAIALGCGGRNADRDSQAQKCAVRLHREVASRGWTGSQAAIAGALGARAGA